MKHEETSLLIHNWNETVNKYKGILRNYLQVLEHHQSDCEIALRQIVTNTGVSLSERKNQMIALIEQQDKVQQLIDGLDHILVERNNL